MTSKISRKLSIRDQWLRDNGYKPGDVVVDGWDQEYVFEHVESESDHSDGYRVETKTRKIYLPKESYDN